MAERRAGWLAVAAVAAATIGIWLAFGVTAAQAARFGAYEAAYVFLPGWTLYELLQPGTRSALRRTVFALALGQVVEVLLFALTAAIGARWLFALYPIAFLPLAWLAWTRRGEHTAGGTWGRWRVDPAALAPWSLALAGVCLLSLVVLVLTHYLATPLPGRIGAGFTYEHDYLFHLSLAGEALHHWPLGDPNVAGTSLPYHWFSYLHLAAIAQVTGMPLPTVYFVLFPAPLLLLLLCELALAAATLGRSLWAGPIAALMLLFVGEIDLSRPEFNPFLEAMPIYLRYSPPFLFGATLFVPLLMALCELLQDEGPGRGQWALLALLTVGCAGAEAAILPLVLAGTGGFLVYRLLVARRLERHALAALALTAVVFVISLPTLYSGASGGLSLSFPAAAQLAPPFVYAEPLLSWGGSFPYWALATVALVLGLLGSVAIGLLWLPRPLRELRAQEVVPVAIFACGLLVLAFLFQESLSERYFAMYGAIAVVPIGAGGLARLLGRWRGAPRRAVLTAAGFGVACLALFSWMVFDNHLGDAAGLGARYLRTYGIFLAIVAGLAIWAWRTRRRDGGRRALYPVIAVLAAAAINLPTDHRSALGHLWSGDPVEAQSGPGLTPSLYAGLRWIEGHTGSDAVLAVDNLRTPETSSYAPLYFYVAAFAERRTLMQGWEYTPKAAELGFDAVEAQEEQPFPERLRLEDAVFRQASLPALRTLQRRYGVTELVVDRRTGIMSPRLKRIARLAYANPALLVFVPGKP